MKRAWILMIFICTTALSFAQYFNDIYYDSSNDNNREDTMNKESETIVVTDSKTTNSSYSDQIASAYESADNTTGGRAIDIDAYNRRGTADTDTATTEEKITASQDFKYTEQIMKYYNPDLVDENDPQYQYLFDDDENNAYYSYTDFNIIVSPAWSYGSFWYDPWWNWNYGWGWTWAWSPYSWYNPWYYPFHPYYPYYGPGWHPAPAPPHRPHTGGGNARPAGANPRTAGSQTVYHRNENSVISGNGTYRSSSSDRSYSTSGNRSTGNTYNGASRGSSSYRSSGSNNNYGNYSGASRGTSSRSSYTGTTRNNSSSYSTSGNTYDYNRSYSGASRGSSSRSSSTGSSTYRNSSSSGSSFYNSSRGSSSRSSSFSTGGASRSTGGASRSVGSGTRSAGR